MTLIDLQNVDNLERMCELPDDMIVEAHGTINTGHCGSCGKLYDLNDMHSSYLSLSINQFVSDKIAESLVPRCTGQRCCLPECTGVIRPGKCINFKASIDRYFSQTL